MATGNALLRRMRAIKGEYKCPRVAKFAIWSSEAHFLFRRHRPNLYDTGQKTQRGGASFTLERPGGSAETHGGALRGQRKRQLDVAANCYGFSRRRIPRRQKARAGKYKRRSPKRGGIRRREKAYKIALLAYHNFALRARA